MVYLFFVLMLLKLFVLCIASRTRHWTNVLSVLKSNKLQKGNNWLQLNPRATPLWDIKMAGISNMVFWLRNNIYVVSATKSFTKVAEISVLFLFRHMNRQNDISL